MINKPSHSRPGGLPRNDLKRKKADGILESFYTKYDLSPSRKNFVFFAE